MDLQTDQALHATFRCIVVDDHCDDLLVDDVNELMAARDEVGAVPAVA